MNLRDVQIATLRISKVLDLIQSISGERLGALIEARHLMPREDTPYADGYEKGFTDGLNAGLSVRSPHVHDFDASEAVAATTALPEDDPV